CRAAAYSGGSSSSCIGGPFGARVVGCATKKPRGVLTLRGSVAATGLVADRTSRGEVRAATLPNRVAFATATAPKEDSVLRGAFFYGPNRHEDPDRRGRDDHSARPQDAARVERLRGLRRGEGRRGGGRARTLARAGPRDHGREDAEARRHRRGPEDPRRTADPDRDADGVRAGGARLARGRGRGVRLPRQAVPGAGSAA